MKANLSTASKEGKPWSATVQVELKGGCIAVKLKRLYDHYKNLTSNEEAVIVLNNGNESIIRATYSSETDLGDGVSEVILQPYWLRSVNDGEVKDNLSFEEINNATLKAFS